MNKKRVLIKATATLPYRNGMLAGVGRSMIELINHLLKISDEEIEFCLYYTGLKSLRIDLNDWPFKKYRLPFSYRGSSKLSSLIEPIIRKRVLKPDLFHITNNYDSIYEGENFIVTIHDMILYETRPELRSKFEQMGKLSKMIVTCSNYSKNEIMRLLQVPSEKIRVIPWGIKHELFHPYVKSQVELVLNKYSIKEPYFFSCSCGDKRKNSDITLEAFRRFSNEHSGYTLVLIWGNCPEGLALKYEQEIKSGSIRIINGVPDKDLACLYSGALATIFISSAEGFGFPLLESFACGTPCVTCNNTSLAELGNSYAFFVKERSVEETSESMNYYAEHGKMTSLELVEYANTFDWNKTAMEYLSVYKETLC